MPLTVAWKLGFAAVLLGAIAASAFMRAPRRRAPAGELRRLVLCSLGLYALGGGASLTHHPAVAAVVYGAGISVAALAAWLSRGRDQEDPPDDGDQPVDEEPPPDPDGVPPFDWAAFERGFREYAERSDRPAPMPRQQD